MKIKKSKLRQIIKEEIQAVFKTLQERRRVNPELVWTISLWYYFKERDKKDLLRANEHWTTMKEINRLKQGKKGHIGPRGLMSAACRFASYHHPEGEIEEFDAQGWYISIECPKVGYMRPGMVKIMDVDMDDGCSRSDEWTEKLPLGQYCGFQPV